MIGFLRGKVLILDPPYLLLDVGNVGYRIISAADVLSSATLGEEAEVFIYHYARENEISLFGFSSYLDLRLFENLIDVSGIGPKTAVNIFSVGKREDIINAISMADLEFFSLVPRLGRKNAQKIIIELKSKIGGLSELDLTEEEKDTNSEAVIALRSFGFSQREAHEALRNIDSQAKTTEEKIRLALKQLGKSV